MSRLYYAYIYMQVLFCRAFVIVIPGFKIAMLLEICYNVKFGVFVVILKPLQPFFYIEMN